jgi:hypothetical protein
MKPDDRTGEVPVGDEQELTTRVVSAFVLSDDLTWCQPSVRVPVTWTDEQIEERLLRRFGGFVVFGLQDDADAPENAIHNWTEE